MGLFDFIKKNELIEINLLKKELLKFNKITDVEVEIKNKKEEFEKLILDKTLQFNKKLLIQTEEYDKKEILLNELNERYNFAKETYNTLNNEINLFDEKINKIEYGIYKPIYNFENSLDYKNESNILLTKQLQLIISERTIFLEKTSSYMEMSLKKTVNISDIELLKFQIHTLMQLAFNNGSSNIILKAKWNNINQLSKQIKRLSKQISDLGKCNLFTIIFTPEYENLKQLELSLHHEYMLKIQNEKEVERANKEALREEVKVRKEYEKAKIDAENEEENYQKSIEKIKIKIANTNKDEHAKLILQIEQLEFKLLEATQKKERAISMAQQTKRGHVYIISNIGAFGENIYKIGMTRRLEPLDRIYELGNASVPFHFDVHAMIYSEDAPNLENELHKTFTSQKLNMLNNRKEFFKINIDVIESKIKELGIEIKFNKNCEAIQYRETLELINKQNIEINLISEKEIYPKNLF